MGGEIKVGDSVDHGDSGSGLVSAECGDLIRVQFKWKIRWVQRRELRLSHLRKGEGEEDSIDPRVEGLSGLVRDELSHSHSDRAWIVPPKLNQSDLDLARYWGKDGSDDGLKAKMVSARIAENAMGRYFAGAGHQVEDVAVKQLINPTGGDWERFDLKVGRTPVDVKNSRRSERNPDQYVSHCVPRFKTNRQLSEVRVAGVLSEYLGKDTLVEDDTPVIFLGLTTAGRIGRMKSELASGPLEFDFREQASNGAMRLPPWVFDYPAKAYERRNSVLAELADSWSPGDLVSGINPNAAALAAQIESGIDPSLPEGQRRFCAKLLGRIKNYGLSLPIVYLSVLEDFVVNVRSGQDGSSRANEYVQLLFPGRFATRPLFLFDPLRTVRCLLQTLSSLQESCPRELGEMKEFQLQGLNYLRGRGPRRDDRWITLIAHCGGSKETSGGRKKPCGLSPLILGQCKSCACGRLVCSECGYCGQDCGYMRDRGRDNESSG